MIYSLIKEVFDNNEWDQEEKREDENEYVIFRQPSRPGEHARRVCAARNWFAVAAFFSFVFILGCVGAVERSALSFGGGAALMALGAVLFAVFAGLAAHFNCSARVCASASRRAGRRGSGRAF